MIYFGCSQNRLSSCTVYMCQYKCNSIFPETIFLKLNRNAGEDNPQVLYIRTNINATLFSKNGSFENCTCSCIV